MIEAKNLINLLGALGFEKAEGGEVYSRNFGESELKVDVGKKKFLYGEAGIVANFGTTSNFSDNENFVVFECVCRLLEKGYKAEDLELEPLWKLGHEQKSGRADILISKTQEDGEKEPLVIIECKTFGVAFDEELKNLKTDGGQLFSYWQQVMSLDFFYNLLYCVKYNKKI